MTITDRFNRFYHAILSEAFTKSRSISFREWRDENTNGCLVFYKGEVPDGDYDRVACPKDTPFKLDTSLKTIFKMMNLDYAIDGESKVSTTKIENVQLCRHIEWITKILNENGIEFDHDIEKWERLKQEAGIYE